MRILYFDGAAGAAGDMIIGALLDAGLPFAELQRALGSLALDGCEVRVERVVRGGLQAAKFRVIESTPGASARHDHTRPADTHGHGHGHAHAHGHTQGHAHTNPHDHTHTHAHVHGHRSLAEMAAIIDRSALSDAGKARARALITRLGEAEAAVHGVTLDEVHLHEVGALDSIIDIVGCVCAFEWFAADRVVVAPLNTGSGTVSTSHGRLPVPAPATVRLLGDAPVYASGPAVELLTPTGALVLTDYADAFGSMPAMRVTASGYGAGDRELPALPNVLRVLVGEADDRAPAMRVRVLECEIDDMNPQIFGALMDRLYAAGALEVFYAPVQMKKNRPGTLLTVVCRPEQQDAMTDLVFRETTTIGLRVQETERLCLDREHVPVDTPFGPVRVKVARRGTTVLNAQPEFDDLVRLAERHGVPIKQVQAAAVTAWQARG